MGKTIIISSHILPELTELCSMIGIIDHGRMRATGPVGDVIAQLSSGQRLRITVLGAPDAAMAVLAGLEPVRDLESVNGAIEARYEGDEAIASDILKALVAADVRVTGFNRVDGGLESAFLKATSEEVG